MRLYISAVLAIIAAAPLEAQGPGPVGMQRVPVPAATIGRQPPRRVDSIPETKWAKGMVIGGAVGFLVGWALHSFKDGMCDVSDCRGFQPVVFLIPMALFGAIGGMIGSGSRK